MALSRAALLLVAAAALVACALAQTNRTDSTYVPSACDNLAQWPTPRPEAPNWSNAVAQLKAEVIAADQPGQVLTCPFLPLITCSNERVL